jgi:iron complex outermembrane recepter protein
MKRLDRFSRVSGRALALALVGMAGISTIPGEARAQEAQTPPDATVPEATSQGPAADQAAADDGGLEEIVVTAQRRGENLQNVPLSITALTGDQLSNSGVTSTQQLPLVTPGLFWGRSTAYSQPTIRGIGSRAGNVGDETNVANYLDGVYQPDMFGTIFELANVERIEVLKGPQGTLFGRNATGGAVSVFTRRPSFTPEGDFSLTYGSFNYIRAGGYISAPIVDDVLAFSLSGVHVEDDGYIDDLNSGDTYGGTNNDVIRGRLLFKPSDRLEIQLNGLFMTASNNVTFAAQPYLGNSAARTGANPTNIPLDVRVPTGRYTTSLSFEPFARTRMYNADLQIRYEFDAFTLAAIFSGQSSRTSTHADLDFSPLPVSFYDYVNDGEAYNQEILLSSNGNGRLRWVIGGNLFQNDVVQHNNANGTFLDNGQRAFAASAFGELTWEVLDNLFVTGGLRYSYDRKNAFYQVLAAGNPRFSGEEHWDDFSPRAVIRYEFGHNSNVYASFSRGFKSGAFNPSTSIGATRPADPEHVSAYEVGVKVDLGRSVRVNAAAYHYDYTDLQTTVIQTQLDGSLVTLLENAQGARINGGELTVEWAVSSHLNLSAGVSLLDATIQDFPNASITVYRTDLAGVPTLNGNLSVLGDVSGNDMLRAPHSTFNISADYRAPLFGGEIQANATFFWSDKYFGELGNRLAQPSYEVLNASITWRAPGERLRFSVFGQNLTDQYYNVTIFPSTLGDFYSYAKPRWFGATVGYSF